MRLTPLGRCLFVPWARKPCELFQSWRPSEYLRLHRRAVLNPRNGFGMIIRAATATLDMPFGRRLQCSAK